MMSVIAVKLPGLGFRFTKDQLFWLTAIPGLLPDFYELFILLYYPFLEQDM